MATVYFETFPAGRQQFIHEGHGYDYRLRSIRAVVYPEPNQMSQVLATEPYEPEPERPEDAWELCSGLSSSLAELD